MLVLNHTSISYLLSRLVRQFSSQPLCRARYKPTWSIVVPGQLSDIRQVPKSIKAPNYVTAIDNLPDLTPSKPDIKSAEQIERLQKSCSVARQILDHVGEHVKAGITTDELDRIAHETCIGHNCYPSPLLYRGFPKSICTSVNNVACHGIPDNRVLVDGDIVSVDVTVFFNGYHGDVSETYCVGSVDSQGRKLVRLAKLCLSAAIAQCGPGRPFSVIGNTISSIAIRNGLSVIENYCGHGIGEYFHGPPDIIHVANNEPGIMQEGMAFTIEPILCDGPTDTYIAADKWTVLSSSRSRSAQFEHTVLVTNTGCQILTQ